jgi:hypothetical protein
MAQPYAYEYELTGAAASDPGPGGFGLSATSATTGRVALSTFDKTGGVHTGLEGAPAGSTLRFVALAPAPAGEWVGTLTAVTAQGYWFDIFASFTETASFPPVGTALGVYLPEVPGGGTWITAAQILVAVGIPIASAAEAEWATVCADAINAGYDRALSGAAVTGTEPELIAQAHRAGAELFKSREAPYGVTGYADLAGTAIRLARDPLEASWPVLRRYATPGIG